MVLVLLHALVRSATLSHMMWLLRLLWLLLLLHLLLQVMCHSGSAGASSCTSGCHASPRCIDAAAAAAAADQAALFMQ
jgi:hypothetical protein